MNGGLRFPRQALSQIRKQNQKLITNSRGVLPLWRPSTANYLIASNYSISNQQSFFSEGLNNVKVLKKDFRLLFFQLELKVVN